MKIKLIIPLPLILGLIVGYTTAGGSSIWYKTLIKPSFTPPDYVFGPVWSILYILMGFAVYLILKSNNNKKAVMFFCVQLILNYTWSYLFFTFNKINLAFYEILVLDLVVLYTVYLFAKLNKKASLLMVPYILWLCVATTLMTSIYLNNAN